MHKCPEKSCDQVLHKKSSQKKKMVSSIRLLGFLFCKRVCTAIKTRNEVTWLSYHVSASTYESMHCHPTSPNIETKVFTLIKMVIEQSAKSALTWTEASRDGRKSTMQWTINQRQISCFVECRLSRFYTPHVILLSFAERASTDLLLLPSWQSRPTFSIINYWFSRSNL